jgi:hypothetical protein
MMVLVPSLGYLPLRLVSVFQCSEILKLVAEIRELSSRSRLISGRERGNPEEICIEQIESG